MQYHMAVRARQVVRLAGVILDVVQARLLTGARRDAEAVVGGAGDLGGGADKRYLVRSRGVYVH